MFYAGHGAIRQAHSNIIFNEEKESDRFENLEQWLRLVTEGKKNNYIIALFDCCRHFMWSPAPEPKINKVIKPDLIKKVLPQDIKRSLSEENEK